MRRTAKMRWMALGTVGSVSCCLLLAVSCRPRAKPKQDFPVEPVASGEFDPNDFGPAEGAGGATQAPKEAAPRCHVVSGSGFILGSPGKLGVGTDEPVDVPFAADLGSALSVNAGFVVGALVPQGKTVEARALWLPSDAKRAVVSSFGVVHGGGPAPALTLNSSIVLAAIPDMASGGKVLRLASVAKVNTEPVVHLGAELSSGRDDSDAFSLATVHGRSLLVWDDLDKKAKPKPHSVIRGVFIAPATLEKPGAPFQVSPPLQDVEAPRLLARGDAFWLVWTKSEGVSGKASTAQLPLVDAGATEEVPWVATETRTLQALLLDAEGKPRGKPVDILAPAGQSLSYECAVDAAGGLVVVFREEGGPGTEPPRLGLVRAMVDGSVARRSFPTPSAPGLPDLLLDEAQKPPALWLVLGEDAGEVRLGALFADLSNPTFINEPALGRSRQLALQGGRMLSAEPKGQAVELRATDCNLGTLLAAPRE